MTTPSNTIEELVGRVEAATGPDREIDALIICATLAPEGSRVEQSTINGAWCIYEPAMYAKGDPWRLWDRAPHELRVNSITSSIDAALALAERLHGKAVMRRVYDDQDGYGANCDLVLDNGDRFSSRGALTWPLAIILATLRSLRIKGDHNDEA